MNPSSLTPIRPNADFLVSTARPHLFVNPHFPATGSEVALCLASEPYLPQSELMQACQSVDEDTLRVGQNNNYLETVVDCKDCCDIYRSRFKK